MIRRPDEASSRRPAAPLFATRSPAQTKNSTPRDKWLVHLIRQFGAVGGRDGHVGEDVGFGLVHQGCELRHLGAELVGDGAPLGMRGRSALLGISGADPGRDDAALRLARVCEHVASEVDAGAVEKVSEP